MAIRRTIAEFSDDIATADIADNAVTAAKVASDVATTAGTQTLTNKTLTTPTLTTPDLNGSELILDADADTSIRADTDDRVDFKLGNTTTFQLDTAGRFGKFSGVTAEETYGGSYYKSGTSSQCFIDRAFNKVGDALADVFLFTFTSGSWAGFWCEVTHSAQSNGANYDVCSKFHINGHSATTAYIVARYDLAKAASYVDDTVNWVFGASPCTAKLQLKHSQGSECSFSKITLASDLLTTDTYSLTWY